MVLCQNQPACSAVPPASGRPSGRPNASGTGKKERKKREGGEGRGREKSGTGWLKLKERVHTLHPQPFCDPPQRWWQIPGLANPAPSRCRCHKKKENGMHMVVHGVYALARRSGPPRGRGCLPWPCDDSRKGSYSVSTHAFAPEPRNGAACKPLMRGG